MCRGIYGNHLVFSENWSFSHYAFSSFFFIRCQIFLNLFSLCFCFVELYCIFSGQKNLIWVKIWLTPPGFSEKCCLSIPISKNRHKTPGFFFVQLWQKKQFCEGKLTRPHRFQRDEWHREAVKTLNTDEAGGQQEVHSSWAQRWRSVWLLLY